MGFDHRRTVQPQATVVVGEDPHNPRSASELLIEPFQHVGAFKVLVVFSWLWSVRPVRQLIQQFVRNPRFASARHTARVDLLALTNTEFLTGTGS